jgi:hypothetical protein
MSEKNGNGPEQYEFDFSKITAAQMDDFQKKQLQLRYRESLVIVRHALVEVPKEWPEDLSQLPFLTIMPLSKRFVAEAKDFKVESSNDFRFEVEAITAADVDDYMQAARLENHFLQAEIMAKYEAGLQKNTAQRLVAWRETWTGRDKKNYADTDEEKLISIMNAEALLAKPYTIFKAARSRFMDEVLNLGKNLNGQS